MPPSPRSLLSCCSRSRVVLLIGLACTQAGRVIDRPAQAVAGDDRLAECDVPEPIEPRGDRLGPVDDAVVERDQLALERALVGDGLLGAPGPGPARVPALGLPTGGLAG